MRSPDEKYSCPLLNREIFWGDCFEVQDIRDDNMDMELFPEKFNLTDAKRICEKCKWYIIA